MRAILLYAALLTGLTPHLHALANVTGWCEIGGRVTVSPAAVASAPVSRNFMQSFPGCTVNVFITGSGGTRSTLFSNNTGTSLTNPFTATTTGFFNFYVTDGYVDIQLSGGGLASPYTIGSVNVIDTNFLASGTNAVARLKSDKLKDVVSVKDFGAVGDGTTNDYTAIVNALNTTKCVLFPEAVYAYSTPIARTDAVCLLGYGRNSRLKYTGTSTNDAFKLDYTGVANGRTPRMENLQIDGNGLATNALHTILSVGGVFRRVELRNVTGVAFLGETATLNTIDQLIVSGQATEAFTTTPVEGIKLTTSSGGNTILDPRIERVSGAGIDFDAAITSNVTGGTSEGNGTGILCPVACSYNTFYMVDLEANTVADATIAGQHNTWVGMLSASAVGMNLNANARNNTFYGGHMDHINVTSTSAYSNQFYGVASVAAITDSGSGTQILGSFNYNTAGYWGDKMPTAMAFTGNNTFAGTSIFNGNVTLAHVIASTFDSGVTTTFNSNAAFNGTATFNNVTPPVFANGINASVQSTGPSWKATGPAGTYRGLVSATSGTLRWQVAGNSVAEGGTDTGTDLEVTSYHDNGTGSRTNMSVNRASGVVVIGGVATLDTGSGANLQIAGPGLQLIGGTQPTCNAAHRGEINLVGATHSAGVKDSAVICAADAADAYAWRTIY